MLLSAVFTGVAYAQGGEPAASSVNNVLAPLAAAALGIERLLEIAWGFIESILTRAKNDFKTDDQDYKKFKTWFSAAVGLMIGYQVAISANLMMFNAIGFPGVTPEVDVIISGIVVGSGTKFTHDVIGIFSQGKQVVEKYKELTESRKDYNDKVVKKEGGDIGITAI